MRLRTNPSLSIQLLSEPLQFKQPDKHSMTDKKPKHANTKRKRHVPRRSKSRKKRNNDERVQ